MAPKPTTQNTKQLTGLARRLIEDNVLNVATVELAVQDAIKNNVSLVQYLVANKKAESLAIAMSACQQFGVPLLDLESIDIKEIAETVPEKIQTQYCIIPLFKRGSNIFLGVSDPTDQRGMDAVRFYTKLNTHMILVEENKLSAILDKGQDTGVKDSAVAVSKEEMQVIAVDDGEGHNKTGDIDLKEEDAPIVRFVNSVLVDAIKLGASDIHFEPYEKTFRIRFRQDGVLTEFSSPSPLLSGRVSARLKVMSRMNIAERRIPQDGKIRLKLGPKKEVDFRVNTMPTLHGEKVVLRILDASTAKAGIDKLGFNEEQMAAFLKAIHKPYGLILVTGPTGSGKTVSLYSALNILNEPSVNISTAEDPVEIQVPGINQVNVSATGGVTFAQALKAFLRQDPDVIMVGEIRDLVPIELP